MQISSVKTNSCLSSWNANHSLFSLCRIDCLYEESELSLKNEYSTLDEERSMKVQSCEKPWVIIWFRPSLQIPNLACAKWAWWGSWRIFRNLSDCVLRIFLRTKQVTFAADYDEAVVLAKKHNVPLKVSQNYATSQVGPTEGGVEVGWWVKS